MCEQGSLKMLSSCALYTSCAVNIISHAPSKIFPPPFCLFFLLLAGELSKATESFRQEMGVHFYASRSTSEVGFYKNHTRIEPMSESSYTLIMKWLILVVYFDSPVITSTQLHRWDTHIKHVTESISICVGMSYVLCKKKKKVLKCYFSLSEWTRKETKLRGKFLTVRKELSGTCTDQWWVKLLMLSSSSPLLLPVSLLTLSTPSWLSLQKLEKLKKSFYIDHLNT